MTVAIILAVLAVLATVAGTRDKIRSEDKWICFENKWTFFWGIVIIATSLITQAFLIYLKCQELNTIAEKDRTVEDANILLKSSLTEIDEASGGAVWENLAYLVDDEVPGLFVYQYSESEGIYKPTSPKPLDIVDNRSCSERSDWQEKCSDDPPKIGKAMIDDLEGAAIDRDGNLYLTTSHSTNKDDGTPEPARAVFLKISRDGHVKRATGKLQAKIRELFKTNLNGKSKNPVAEYKNEREQKLEIMHIEGLAIDNENRIYLGFKAPLVDNKYALVLRCDAEQIFTDDPEFKVFLLDLQRPDGQYGITSLEYDTQNDRILILGNNPDHFTSLKPVIWSWQVSNQSVVKPPDVEPTEPFNGEIFTNFGKDAPGSRPAKPEILLMPKADRLHLFFDAKGTGGQLGLKREGLNLERIKYEMK